MKTSERVILIKGDATKWYDQAIFIVNKEIPPEKIPVDFVSEAEKIINNYLVKKSRAGLHQFKQSAAPAKAGAARKTGKSRFDFILNMVTLLGCVVIAGALFFGLMK
ncbi:MAG: hypothetical protein LBR83_09725 [Clostridiales bacterium]|jgi:hypothetical protein|nr:hypothetical protein [Clostridiales bacterium]